MSNTLTQQQLGGLIVAVLGIGIFLGFKLAPQRSQEATDLQMEVDSLKERNQRYSALKMVDDLAFQYCGEMVGTLSAGADAYAKNDVKALQSSAEKMTLLNEKMSIQLTDREKVLKELGY